jgi:hypothetical protein
MKMRCSKKSVWQEPYTEKCTAHCCETNSFPTLVSMRKESVHFCHKAKRHTKPKKNIEFVSQGQYSTGIAKKQVFFAQAAVKQKSVWQEPYTEKRTAQAAKQTFLPTNRCTKRACIFA